MAGEMYIARHGQNTDNDKGLLNGHRDEPLTEYGEQQAHDLASGIIAANIKIGTIYCSPLIRAEKTAQIVGQTLGIKEAPTILPDLIERNFGMMAGKPIADIEKICGSDNVLKTHSVTYFLDVEGAETFPQLLERGHRILDEVRSLQSGKESNTLLVCHGDIGKMIYAAATGISWEEALRGFHFGNGDLIDINPDNSAQLIQLPQRNS